MRTVHLKYAKRCLRQIVRDALGSGVPVVWGSHPSIPRPPRPFCRLSITLGPQAVLTDHDETRIVEAIDLAAITVDSAVVGELYRMRLNGIPLDYTALGGDDVEAIRDGWLAAIAAENLTDFFTVAASGLDTIDVTPTAIGTLFGASSFPPANTTTVLTQTGQNVEQVVGRREAIAQVDFFADGDTTLEDGTLDLASDVRAQLSTASARAVMQRYRVPLRAFAATVHLPALEGGGAHMESHTLFEVHMAMSSCTVSEAIPIESVEITNNISGETNTYVVT